MGETVYILDTDILSNYLNSRRNYPHLSERIARADPKTLFVSVITAAQILKYALRLANIGNEPGLALEARIHGLEGLRKTIYAFTQFEILGYDVECESRFQAIPSRVRLHHPTDCRIAATASAHGFTVVTRNLRDFEKTGVPCEDWTQPPLRVVSP